MLDVDYLATAALVMAVGMVGFLFVSAIFADKIPTLSVRFGKHNQALVAMITSGAIIGAISNMAVSNTFPVGANTVSVLFAAAVMFTLKSIKKKHPEKLWISKWSVGISMFSGMFAGYFTSLIL